VADAAADLMPKRMAFIDWAAKRHLDVAEDVDAWGKRKFAHSHVEAMWEGWFNAPAAPAVIDIGLPELRDVLKGACLSGEHVTLSHLSAGALYYAMTTGEPQAALPALAESSVLPLSLVSDEEMSNFANYHQGERIVRAAPASAPAGYIDRQDLPKLGNCRLPLHAKFDKIDPVPLFRAPPDAMLQEFLSIIHDRDLAVGDRLQRVASRITFYCKVRELEEDPVDIIRTLLHTVDHYWTLPDEKREAYPSPTAEFSPLMQAARRACIERGFTAGGLAVDPVGSAA
jgi:hypothetical protein